MKGIGLSLGIFLSLVILAIGFILLTGFTSAPTLESTETPGNITQGWGYFKF